MHFEKLTYYFFVQPNSNIIVEFDEKKMFDTKEKFNPFIEPAFIAAKVRDTSDGGFNSQIIDIDNKSDKIILAVARQKKEDDRRFKDSLLNVFKNSIMKSEYEFVNNYTKYRIAVIKYLFKSMPAKDFNNEYFTNKPVQFQNPAYCELLNIIYEKYLLHRTQQSQGNIFRQAINKGNLSAIKEMLNNDTFVFSDNFCDVVILQNAFNEFYDSNFSRSALLMIIDSVANKTTNAEIKKIALDIHNTIVKLLVGYSPPNFDLRDIAGNLKSLKSFADKYIYLGFFSVNSYGCIQDFHLINRLAKKFNNKIHFVSICIDTEADVKNFIISENFNWTFLLYDNKSDLLKSYDVRTFPTYYLIDKNGKLLKSPAPSPSENIENIFNEIE
jgi:peroxiredoxin